MHGVTDTYLNSFPEQVQDDLAAALDDPEAQAAVRRVVAAHPALLDGWARLAEFALADDDPVAAYAFARTGYHRGLDAIRRAGWKGQGPVPWSHEPNRGFLRSVNALRLASIQIGEEEEIERLRAFLLELDPDDHHDVTAS